MRALILGVLNPKSTVEGWTGVPYCIWGMHLKPRELFWNGDVTWVSSGCRQHARTVLLKEKFQ